MTRAEQIRRVLDEWRTVSERRRQQLCECIDDIDYGHSDESPDYCRALNLVVDDIIRKRGDMNE